MIKKAKRKIGLFLFNNKESHALGFLYKLLAMVNCFFFHWSGRMHLEHPGTEDDDITYYVIRPETKTEGLLSLYYYVLTQVLWANSNNFVSFIYFDKTNCQYYVDRTINGTQNAWEYYFTQPCNIKSIEEIMKKKNVLYSGWSFKKRIKYINKDFITINDPFIRDMMQNSISVQPYILDMADEYCAKFFINKKILGVFIRGTDYISLKPKGHYIQPTIDSVLNIVDEFLNKHNPDNIFLVTEDYSYFSVFKEKYKDLIICSDNNFIKEYDNKSLVADVLKDDPYSRGLNYLLRMILLTRCHFLVSSITNGSLFSYGLKKDQYEDSYWFNLGKY